MFSTYAIRDIFNDCTIIHAIPDFEHREYKAISILPPQFEEMYSEILYVCRLREALGRDAVTPGFHYVCISDLPSEDAAELLTNSSGIFCIASDHDMFWLFSRLQNRFLTISNWVNSMTNAIIHNCDFQELVDLSEDIIRNPIFVQDSSLHLLATSRNYEGSSELQRTYQKTKYHTPEFIKLLEERGRLKKYNHAEGLTVIKDHAMEPFDLITKYLRKNGMIFLAAGVSCSVTPESPYYDELVGIFCDHIFLCAERKSYLYPYSSCDGGSLIQDLITGAIRDKGVIADCARAVRLPLDGPFLLYRISWNQNENLFSAFVEQELKRGLEQSNIFYSCNELLVIRRVPNSDSELPLDEQTLFITSVTESHHCRCCISEPFETLAELKNAYDQCRYTVRFVEKLLSDANPFLPPISKQKFSERWVYTYREVFLQSIFEHYNSSGPCSLKNIVYVDALRRLVEFDNEHDRNLVEILYHYICNERNAAKTGKQLFMSRNNVLYHIANATKIIDLNLDDHNTRFALLVAYNLLGIYF
ncbi:MAG: helix-turn-helix domain-containing protein [Lachnospiraceae bacterium]|nr:helix-turn-helix domain-containing protein [Lachnospiraceae bacterium]